MLDRWTKNGHDWVKSSWVFLIAPASSPLLLLLPWLRFQGKFSLATYLPTYICNYSQACRQLPCSVSTKPTYMYSFFSMADTDGISWVEDKGILPDFHSSLLFFLLYSYIPRESLFFSNSLAILCFLFWSWTAAVVACRRLFSTYFTPCSI